MEKIPEIYFTKLELQAELLDEAEKEKAEKMQLGISLDSALEMAKILNAYFEKAGDAANAERFKKTADTITALIDTAFPE